MVLCGFIAATLTLLYCAFFIEGQRTESGSVFRGGCAARSCSLLAALSLARSDCFTQDTALFPYSVLCHCWEKLGDRMNTNVYKSSVTKMLEFTMKNQSRQL